MRGGERNVPMPHNRLERPDVAGREQSAFAERYLRTDSLPPRLHFINVSSGKLLGSKHDTTKVERKKPPLGCSQRRLLRTLRTLAIPAVGILAWVG